MKIMQEKEKAKNKKFHKKFAEMTEIPLTLWGYIYGDLETKGGGGRNLTKLQRMNSISSKMSKKSIEGGTIKNLR